MKRRIFHVPESLVADLMSKVVCSSNTHGPVLNALSILCSSTGRKTPLRSSLDLAALLTEENSRLRRAASQSYADPLCGKPTIENQDQLQERRKEEKAVRLCSKNQILVQESICKTDPC